MLYRFLISPNAFAINCEITNSQFIAERLYLKNPITRDTKINLYDDESNLAAIITVGKTNSQEHQNVTLKLC